MKDSSEVLLFSGQLAAAGMPDDWAIGFHDFVRFSDVDAFQHVNNAAYLKWFETLRILYFMDLERITGVARPKMALRSGTMEFNAPMFLHESYTVLGRISQVGRSSFLMDYAVWSESTYKMTSTAAMVTIDESATKAIPIPGAYRKIMIERDGATEK